MLRWSDLGPDFYDLCSNLDLFAQSRVVTGGGEEKEDTSYFLAKVEEAKRSGSRYRRRVTDNHV